ncbi:hypothetical protein D3C76_1188690 [compost metagenome]
MIDVEVGGAADFDLIRMPVPGKQWQEAGITLAAGNTDVHLLHPGLGLDLRKRNVPGSTQGAPCFFADKALQLHHRVIDFQCLGSRLCR